MHKHCACAARAEDSKEAVVNRFSEKITLTYTSVPVPRSNVQRTFKNADNNHFYFIRSFTQILSHEMLKSLTANHDL